MELTPSQRTKKRTVSDTHPDQRISRVAELINLYGRSSNDFFKLWPPKSYFFSGSDNGVVAYGVSHGVALAMGEPVAPDQEMATTIDEFLAYCRTRRLHPVFHQVSNRYLDLFRQHHLHAFKASEAAIVDLNVFTTSGHAAKHFRNTIRRIEATGIQPRFFDPPVPDDIIRQARTVSDSWLTSGRRERSFDVGRFTEYYVRVAPMLAAFDAGGVMQGFVNIIPSFAPETVTIDMMRHRSDVSHSLMDYLFLKLFAYEHEQGFHYFDLGPATIVELPTEEPATLEERSFYRLARHLDAVFSMTGLRNYKEKFATRWEPLYMIHRRVTDWPQVLRAFTDLTELPENRQPLFSRERRQQLRRITADMLVRSRASRMPRAKAAPHPSAQQGPTETPDADTE
jgi:phosphatidylglycerol lysyltransferase